ncbi:MULTISPECIES: hypothetical protein [unclassified Streptomyces]|uniref:hypothetical protein n=1 Tax=unclassified Streptomyces TaxID=2593676 RepID=UPI00332EF4EF
MRISRIAPVVVAAALLTAGCGSEEDSNQRSSAGDGSSREQHKPVDQLLAVGLTGPQSGVVDSDDGLKTPEPKPDSGAEFTEKVEHKLRRDLLRAAKVNGETTADCPDGVTLKASATSACTATYEGVEIPYEVTVSDSYKEGGFLIQYDAEPQKDLLVAQRVYHEFWEQRGADGGGGYEQKVSCDEMPAAQAVNRGADTGHRCQVWHELGGEDGAGRVTAFAVWTGTYGPDFRPVGG